MSNEWEKVYCYIYTYTFFQYFEVKISAFWNHKVYNFKKVGNHHN